MFTLSSTSNRRAAARLKSAKAPNTQQRVIDTAKSVIAVRAFKAGLLSAMGHNLEIVAPIAAGSVDVTARQVELHAQTRELQIRDSAGSAKDREEIQSTMLGPTVLDADRNTNITFRSTSVDVAGAGSWKIRGELTCTAKLTQRPLCSFQR
jgi:polyisoprenoid-binding protein YceI